MKPFLGMFPFSNVALNRDRDFDLSIDADNDKVDKHLTDFIGMKQMHSGNKILLQYQDTRNGRLQSFVKVAAATNDKSFKSSRGWLDLAIKVNSDRDNDEWEKLNSHIVTATAGDVCQPVAGPLVAHLRAVGDARVYFYQ